jgi:glycosyltransferase involved in cell wall biosynthesis
MAGLAARGLRPLPPLCELPDTEMPTVTCVVAARDEAERLETTVRQIAAQQGVRLELVVVDDRSRDVTPSILERLRGELPCLRSLRIEELPAGWLGKCHALHQGARLASGEWLVFVDGDIWMAPDVMRRAVAAASAAGVQHVALTPHLRPASGRPPGFLYQACLVPMAGLLSLLLDLANRDLGFAGIGAFNLMRTELYRSFGGHELVRLDVADDMKLGLLLRRAGGRTRIFAGHDDLFADYASDIPGILRALEKNHFAVLAFDTGLSVATFLAFVGLWLGGLLGPLTGHWSGVAAGLGLASLALAGVAHARCHGQSAWAGLLMPLTVIVGAISQANSTWRTLRQGGIRWRNTFSPLADLRRGWLRVRS